MLEPMPRPRHGIGTAVVGNRIIIPGGSPVEGFGTTAQSDFFAVNEELLLPQFLSGGPYSTSIIVTNPDASRVAQVTVSLTGLDGSPLETNLGELPSDSVFRSSITMTIPPLSSRTAIGAEATSALKVGTARVRSDVRVSAYANIRGPGPQLTVYPTAPSRNLIFDARRLQSGGVHTGVAILNLSCAAATVTVRFHDRVTGQAVLQAERTLAPHEQVSRFVHELFPELQSADFAGTVTVQSTAQLAVAALSFDPSGVVTIPVVPIE
jgi:hypothetical protein